MKRNFLFALSVWATICVVLGSYSEGRAQPASQPQRNVTVTLPLAQWQFLWDQLCDDLCKRKMQLLNNIEQQASPQLVAPSPPAAGEPLLPGKPKE